MVVVLQRCREDFLHVSEHHCQILYSWQFAEWTRISCSVRGASFYTWPGILGSHYITDQPHVMALKINVKPVLVNLKYWVYIALRFIVHRHKSKSMLTEFIQLHHEPKHDEWTGWIMSPTTTNEIKYSAGQLNTLVSVSLILSDHITTDSASVLSSL